MRSLYLTQFSVVTSRMKKALFNELRNYAKTKIDLNQKYMKLSAKINRKKKNSVIQELRQYTEDKILLKQVTYKAQSKLKANVLSAMALACRK